MVSQHQDKAKDCGVSLIWVEYLEKDHKKYHYIISTSLITGQILFTASWHMHTPSVSLYCNTIAYTHPIISNL